MNDQCKIIITGVGGQGVVFLTEILVEAAMKADIPVATSEVHGLSQRGGSVISGITFGKNTYGFVENNGADFLLGLELLEAQRCINFLHKGSIAVIDNTKILPHNVNSGRAEYPDEKSFINYLRNNIKEVTFIDNNKNIEPVMRNIIVLAKAALHKNFPVKPECIEQAIKEYGKGNQNESLKIFRNTINRALP